MRAWQQFDEICQAMADPAFYPHPVTQLERRDTHISTVFLTGDWAYKLKKPVEFGFLDFRELAARRHFCHQEVFLNQRFSRDVYQGVVRICRDRQERLALDGPGEEIEYAVKMVQLPETASLKERLRSGRASRSDMELLGRYVAEFYRNSTRSPDIDRFGDPEVIGFNVAENFRQVEPFSTRILDPEKLALIRVVSQHFLERWRGLFHGRVAAGRIRDGHGDLRTDHIYFLRGIQIIDCIEFNDRFRYGDVTVDLAFLYMDMDHRGHGLLARDLLAAYAHAADDPEIYVLLDFYAAYRAMVMVKVHCFRYAEVAADAALGATLESQIRRHLEQAYRYAVQFSRPTLWIICGLPATGKSTLAEKAAQALSLPLFHSDRVRRELLGMMHQRPVVVPFGEGIYRQEINALVYGQLLALAQQELKRGRPVILDATFSHRHWREEARRLASDLDVDVIFVECRSSLETVRSRLISREARSGMSDARLLHLEAFLSHFDPLDELPPDLHVAVDTDQPLAEAFADVLAASYARKCAQVENLL